MFRQGFVKIGKNIRTIGKIRLLFILTAILIFLSCSAALIFSVYSEKESVRLPVVDEYDLPATEAERKNLKLGIVTGPYGDMFKEAIQPLLAKKGYTVELVLYDNYTQPNFALANGEIDLNIFQNYRYLNNFKFNHDLNLSAITEIPTASMGIFSLKYNSLEAVPVEAVVAIPNDTTNRSRAFIVLETVGLVTIDPFVDKSKATEKNLIKNPKNIRIVLTEAKNLVKSLDKYDMAIINGNFAISGGLSYSDALYKEVLAENYINIIAVRTDDLNKQFVRDLIEAIHSDEYRTIITDPNGKYTEFQRPRSLLHINN